MTLSSSLPMTMPSMLDGEGSLSKVKHWRRSISSTRGRLRGIMTAGACCCCEDGDGRGRDDSEGGMSSSMTICVGMGGCGRGGVGLFIIIVLLLCSSSR